MAPSSLPISLLASLPDLWINAAVLVVFSLFSLCTLLNLSSCVLFVCFCLFMLMCSHSIPPVQTFALNSRFSSHQCNKYLYLALHISNLTYPKWKNSVSLLSRSVITTYQVIQARNLEVILTSSLLSFSHFQSIKKHFLLFSHSIHHGSFHFSIRYQHLFPDCSILVAGPPHFPACLAAETGWGGGRGEEKWPEATTDQWEEDRHPNRKMGQVFRRFTEEEIQMPFKLVKDVHV